MEPWLVPGLLLSVPVVVGAVAFFLRREAHRRFIAGFVDDAEHVAVATLLGGVRVSHREGLDNVLTVKTSRGRNNSVPLWDIVVDGVGLGARTSLQISREGLLGALRDAVGFRDVEVGDADFDGRFKIRGHDADVVRGALGSDEARAAIADIFDDTDVWQCRLDRRGRLHVVVRRERLDPQEARHRLACVRRLAAALHAARDVAPLLEPVRGVVGAVSSSSGAPVGFGAR